MDLWSAYPCKRYPRGTLHNSVNAQMQFYLCRVFGRPYYQEPEKNLGVPIVNGMPEDMDNLDLPDRSSVKDTYEQVLSDLKKAEELISDFKSPAYA